LLQIYLLCAVGSGFSVYNCLTGDTLLDKANVHDGKVLGVVPAFYGYMLVTYSEDGTIKLWGNHDVLSGQQQLSGEPSALKPDTSQNEAAFLQNFGTR
jgi:WD40 repeat protein